MDVLHDMPMKIDIDVRMTPITPEISAVDIYIDEMILILDETPSFDNQTAKQVSLPYLGNSTTF